MTVYIHALHEEGDRHICTLCKLSLRISIHALREEGDRPAL